MKQTLSTNQIADALRQDQYAGWSYNGAYTLAEYLEEFEANMGEEMDLDVVAIRCDYSEYTDCIEAAQEFGFEVDTDLNEDEQEEAAGEWLRDQTMVIEFDGGVIALAF